jgi:hypothetical protein
MLLRPRLGFFAWPSAFPDDCQTHNSTPQGLLKSSTSVYLNDWPGLPCGRQDKMNKGYGPQLWDYTLLLGLAIVTVLVGNWVRCCMISTV